MCSPPSFYNLDQGPLRLSHGYRIQTDRGRTTSREAVYFSAIAYSLFSGGRFVATGLIFFLRIKPRYVLLLMTIGAFITSTYAMLGNGIPALATLLLVYFFEATTWPTIYVLAMRGQGRRIKLTSALLVSSCVGGAFLPGAQYGIAKAHTLQLALGIAVACFGGITFLPLFTSLSASARKLVDPAGYAVKRTDSPHDSFSNEIHLVTHPKNESFPSADFENADPRIVVERSFKVERSV